jgi:hypothetical protein
MHKDSKRTFAMDEADLLLHGTHSQESSENSQHAGHKHISAEASVVSTVVPVFVGQVTFL